MVEILAIAIIVVYFFICYLVASVFQEIAEMKGHNKKRYFWWCFWVGPIGMLMVIALPDRHDNSIAGNTVIDELPDL